MTILLSPLLPSSTFSPSPSLSLFNSLPSLAHSHSLSHSHTPLHHTFQCSFCLSLLHPSIPSTSPDLPMDSFSTKSLALQAQKKLMSKMATKSMANLFIDDTSSEVLDELYRVTKEYTHNRKEAQKIIKNLIKMVVKLGVLYRNNQFNVEELVLVDSFRWGGSLVQICLLFAGRKQD